MLHDLTNLPDISAQCQARMAVGENAVVESNPTGELWLVLLPVKSTTVGKSRILLDPHRRSRLARAMALDTVTAVTSATRVESVLALVDDEADAAALGAMPGVHVHRSGVRGLNEAIGEACALPAVANRPVAVLPADLPSLRPEELDGALLAAAGLGRAVVPDRQGTGTTLLTATRAALLRPRYGPGSFAAHLATGAVPLAIPGASGLRRDVDVLDDLRDVTGPLTSAEAHAFRRDTAVG